LTADACSPASRLAVHGCGGVGLSAVQIAAAADAMVVAVDVDDRKLAKAVKRSGLWDH
jgi:D-arabinose 1-dehydrogenase-like Zn-dependent alcohol dehydrogenase